MTVTIFKAYPFKVGQKITIKDSPRAGDWEVINVTEHKVSLRCPFTQKEVTWSRFCYVTEEKEMSWPGKE